MNSSKLCVASKFLETLVEDGKQHIEPKHLALGAITIREYFGHATTNIKQREQNVWHLDRNLSSLRYFGPLGTSMKMETLYIRVYMN